MHVISIDRAWLENFWAASHPREHDPMAALLARAGPAIARATDVANTALAPVFAYVAIAQEKLSPLLPYLIRTFHIGFVPLVILVGYRSTHPRPSLTDLLSPM
jgi:hypothetical protein